MKRALRSPLAVSPQRRPTSAARPPASPGNASAPAGSRSVSAPAAVAATGSPAAIASAQERPNVSLKRDGTIASAAPARRRSSSASLTRPTKRTSAPRRAASARSSASCGPCPVTTSGRPACAQASIATSTPLSGAIRAEQMAYSPFAGSAFIRAARTGLATTWTSRPSSGAPSARSRATVNALGATSASADSTSRGDHFAIAAA